MKTKKIFALFLSIILMFGICVPTFAAVPNTDPIMPLYNVASGMLADIYISGKYSLQGTTQGRYLTGGVPPVRFSM